MRKPARPPSLWNANAMAGLLLYRALTGLGAPLINHFLRRRLAAGKEHPERFGERQGIASRARPRGPLAWIHAASVGEAQSALALIEKMLRSRIDLHILITTGTVTSARILAERLPPRSFHQFAPVDRLVWVRRFLDHWDPDMAIWIESEFWPNLISETAERRIPAVLVNGRISRKSAANWRYLPGFIRNIVSEFELCVAQSEDEAARFRRLGANPVHCVGNLKFSAAPLPVDEAELERLAAMVGARPFWLAASTHPGEEAIIADAHMRLRAQFGDLLTIIVPRHPARGAAIARDLAARDLVVSRRTDSPDIESGVDIHIADTLGELGLFYRLAGIVFVGGSLRRHGGHNPLEPAQLDCAVLYGPDMANFTTIAEQLAQAGAATQIEDAQTLGQAVARFLDDPAARQSAATAAAQIANANTTVVDRVLELLQPLIDGLPAGDPDARA
jgi:3-deoxy-D-manno-octulosonic-acid transferase